LLAASQARASIDRVMPFAIGPGTPQRMTPGGCSRRTTGLGHPNQCGRSPTPGPGRLETVWVPRNHLRQLAVTASFPRSARAWTGNGTPRELRGLKHRPDGRCQDGPDPLAACLPPALAPADLRVRRRWAAVPGCPRRPAQRKPLRPDLAPGPRRSHAGRRNRHPAGTPPLRSAPSLTTICRSSPPALRGLRRLRRTLASSHA
jgi:hypothetical protein